MKPIPGRMISKDISNSQKIARLGPKALSLFCLLIPHFNPHGKMNGNPHFIKGEVCPLIDWLTIETIQECLKEISQKTNVKWWSNGKGIYCLQSLSWGEHQKLRKDRLGTDYLPSYKNESKSSPGLVLDSSGVKKKVKKKLKKKGLDSTSTEDHGIKEDRGKLRKSSLTPNGVSPNGALPSETETKKLYCQYAKKLLAQGFNAHEFWQKFITDYHRDDIFSTIEYVATSGLAFDDEQSLWAYCHAALKTKKQERKKQKAKDNLEANIQTHEKLKQEEEKWADEQRRKRLKTSKA